MSDKTKIFFSIFPEKKPILLQFLAFKSSFSIDWLSNMGVLPSNIFSVIAFLKKHNWIKYTKPEGYFSWTDKFPREDILKQISENEMREYYRNAVDILSNHVIDWEDKECEIAHICILGGIKESDLNLIFRAALAHEKKQRISKAVDLYDNLLSFLNEFFTKSDDFSEEYYQLFKTAVERRSTFCFRYPSLKRLNKYIQLAIKMAIQVSDLHTQALMKLLLSMNNWMNFKHDEAILHLDESFHIIQQIGDIELSKRAQQMRGLVLTIQGDIVGAIQFYEESLSELEDIITDDISIMAGFQMALFYAQVGMPQRGLGILDTIYTKTIRTENRAYASFALLGTGIILGKMNHIDESRDYFQRCIDTRHEDSDTFLVYILAKMHLASIYCKDGDIEKAQTYIDDNLTNQYPTEIWRPILRNHVNFEPTIILIRNGLIPQSLISENIDQIGTDVKKPFSHAVIRRLYIKHMEKFRSPQENINELLILEKKFNELGAKIELGNVRIDLCHLYQRINCWAEAESYGKSAWEVLKAFAKSIYPTEFRQFIENENLSERWRFANTITEMVESLASIKENERIIGDIMKSISRITGAERIAIFKKENVDSDPQLIASRNFPVDYSHDESVIPGISIMNDIGRSNIPQSVKEEITSNLNSDVYQIIISSLYSAGKIIGFLYQDSRFFHFDSHSEDIQLFNMLSSHVALVLHRIWTHEENVRLNEHMIEVSKYYKDEKECDEPFKDIVGESPQIMSVQSLIRKVAITNSTVLIQGETGVGKELVAHAIHRESQRKDGPFIRVNCATLPENLIDSELFGYDQGAFTGAKKTKPGRFELAHNGTIFLDEISELPLVTQSRLLRILQEKEFQRLGGIKTIHVDFRLIAATNKTLEKEVEANRFRSDLFYRLNVFPVKVPPLRDRGNDISLLVMHFLKLYAAQFNKPYIGIHPNEMEKLIAYSWPGNVRELANVIERAVILSECTFNFSKENKHGYGSFSDIPAQLKEVERDAILKALQNTNGKVGGKEGAAALLGLKRTTLINRMIKLGIYSSKNTQ